MNNFFDICIIGGGHAGSEAAWIASQFKDLSVAIVTMPEVPLASTPCNPAIGGVGKGQVVRELDALGGFISQIADSAGIQYRILNESKGYAVQSTRAQVDKDAYASEAKRLLSSVANLTIIYDVVKLINQIDDGFAISTFSDSVFCSKKIIITTGTFLDGKLHTGNIVSDGGRVDARSAPALSSIFEDVCTLSKKFKTGTPARLKADTINFSGLEPQPSDDRATNFHWKNSTSARKLEQVTCYLTRTNSSSMKIIRDNKEKSPMYNGQIVGVGPRYCPSIEDKAFRYEDRDSHHVFLEPEGLSCNTVYPNGISTSLPKDVQLDFIRTISGLENVEIDKYGYAVEYDVVDTTKLNICLEYIDIPGLYFAGQVNGTSGYEEAAAQGYVAGVNAALSILGRPAFVIDRNESYIGVLVEDLVSNKRDEPYRLFTARSENRLYIREDNTIQRMNKYRLSLDLNDEIDLYQNSYIYQVNILANLIGQITYRPSTETVKYFIDNEYGELSSPVTLYELLKRSNIDPVKVLAKELIKLHISFPDNIINTVAISTKYDGYITRSDRENERFNKIKKKQISWNDLINNKNISNECRQRIRDIRPETFGQLQNIVGIRPATIAYVAGVIW